MASYAAPIYNKATIAYLYGVTVKTLNAWFQDEDFMADFGKYRGKAFTPKQVRAVVKHFGPFRGYQLPVDLV